ncbi:YitT family protein [Anaeropeptidivorans aminofermentans]|jgi:uncharacterized membrane-anchored protein YitT (DUF2179 family)|uniref:YitT family protein n=1 Tax=Anaeropeptidivorans aminofermentans TaxID=2934315 RepID=UPI00202468B8|nr:YitT family protein [Anaeropeptidivorans aminofermentans]MBE6011970.1 YitT family protein [Lachnospiraceae bacterium]
MLQEYLKEHREGIKEYLYIIFGTALVAIGVVVFFEPHNLVTGGVTGLAIIIADLGRTMYGVTIPIWLTNLFFNIPLFLMALRTKGKKFLARTFITTMLLTTFLSLAEFIPVISEESDLVISTLFGAVFVGIGMGFVFRAQTTTGGTDIAASVIHKYFRHISIAKILFFVDAIIITIGFFVFGIRITMYGIIAVYITSRFTDTVLEGFDFAKAAFIISDKHEEISMRIMTDTERGATAIHAKGVYTQKEKDVILVVMNKKEIIMLKELVTSVDPRAFLIVTDVREVLGEGFQRIV